MPAIGVSTSDVYRHLSPVAYTDGTNSQTICQEITDREDCSLNSMNNCLEQGMLQHYPQVARARTGFFAAGASFVRLSRSGPTLFAPFASLTPANTAQHHLATLGHKVYLTSAHPVVPVTPYS